MASPPVKSSGSRSVKRLVFTTDTKLQDGPGRYQELFKNRRRRRLFEAGEDINERLQLQMRAEHARYHSLGDWSLPNEDEPQLLDYLAGLRSRPENVREAQMEVISARFASRFSFARAWFIEDLRKLDFVVLALVYCNPKHAILGSKDDFGPAQATDPRSKGQRLNSRLAALEKDALRHGALAEGAPVQRTMIQCHPSVFSRYSISLAESGIDFNPPSPSEEQQKLATMALKVYSAIFNTIAIQRHRFLAQDERRNEGLDMTDEEVTLFDLRNLLAIFPAQDVSRLDGWLINASDAVYGEEPTLQEIASLSINDELSPPWLAPPDITQTRTSYEPDCPLAQALIDGEAPAEDCHYPFCSMKLPLEPIIEFQLPHGSVESRMLRHYPLAEARSDCRAGAGPWDLRLEGARLVMFYHDSLQWPNLQQALKVADFFVTIKRTRIVGIHSTGWTLAAYRRAKFSDVHPPPEAFTVLNIVTLNGVTLAIQVNFGGLGEKPRGVDLPPLIVKLLEDPKIRKYQFNVKREKRCLAAINVKATSMCEASNRAAFAFPQPNEDLLQVRTGATFVATQLALPSVFEPVRPARKGDKKSAKALLDKLGDSLTVEHNGRILVNIAHMDYSKHWEQWHEKAVMYMFFEAALPLIFVVREAVAIMDNLNYPDNADVMRYVLFLVDQVLDTPQVSAIPARSEKDVRPFGGQEFMHAKNARPGPAFLHVSQHSQTVNEDKNIIKTMTDPTMQRPVDWAGCTPQLKADLAEIVSPQDLAKVTLNQVIDSMFNAGASFPHRCLKCGSNDHCSTLQEASAAAADEKIVDGVEEQSLSPRNLSSQKIVKKLPLADLPCKNNKVRCAYPLCGSLEHVLAVCPLLVQKCTRCSLYGHSARHHMAVPFLRLIEDFCACAPFHCAAVTLTPNLRWIRKLTDDNNIELAVEAEDKLMDQMPESGLPLAFLRPQAL